MRLFDTLNLFNVPVWTSCAHSAITTHLTSMCLRCRQCPCLSAGWTYLHLCICLGLMNNTCRIVSRLFRWTLKVWPIKAAQCYSESLTFFYIQPCLCSVKVSSRLNCFQTVSLWLDWSASVDGKEAGAAAKGFAGSYSKLVNNSGA